MGTFLLILRGLVKRCVIALCRAEEHLQAKVHLILHIDILTLKRLCFVQILHVPYVFKPWIPFLRGFSTPWKFIAQSLTCKLLERIKQSVLAGLMPVLRLCGRIKLILLWSVARRNVSVAENTHVVTMILERTDFLYFGLSKANIIYHCLSSSFVLLPQLASKIAVVTRHRRYFWK